MRELNFMLKQIDARLHNNMAIEASFHGIKIPMNGQSSVAKPVESTESEVAAMDRARSEAKLRKAQEFRKRYG